MTEKLAEAAGAKGQSTRVSDTVSAISEALTRETAFGLPDYGKAVLDGWMKAGQAWTDGMREIGQTAVGIGEHQLLRNTECLRGLSTCETMPDLIDRQRDFVSQSTNAYFEEARVVAETLARTVHASWSPVADGFRTALEQSVRRPE